VKALRVRQLGRYVLTVQAAAERWLSYGSAVILCVLTLLAAGDVIMRYIFNNPIDAAFELTGFLLLGFIVLSFAYVQGKRGHIALTFIVDRLQPTPRLALDIFALGIGLLLFAAMTYMGWFRALESWEIGEFSSGLVELPVYPAKFLLAIGASLMFFRLILDFISQLARLPGLTSTELTEEN